MDKNIVLAGFDLEVLELIESIESINIVGYTDINKIDLVELNYLGTDTEVIENFDSSIEVILTMDSPKIRAKLFEFYRNNIFNFIAHQTSNISKRSEIGYGTVLQAKTFISANVKLGKGCFINHSSAIHHESTIGDFTILAPNSLILGRVEVGNQCYIGAGAIIKENIKIGSNVVVGAGSVVVDNIPDNAVVVGNPAKRYLG